MWYWISSQSTYVVIQERDIKSSLADVKQLSIVSLTTMLTARFFTGIALGGK